MLSLDAPASSLSLSETSSDIRFGDEPGSLKHTHRRLLTQKLLFCPAIMMKLEQVVGTEKPYYSSWLLLDYLRTNLFVYQTAVGIISQVEFVSHSVSYTSGSALKIRIISAGYCWTIYGPIRLCVSNCSWNCKPSGVCFSQCKLYKW